MSANETAHIFVGSDRSQLLAVRVLEHSIKRHTSMPIKLQSMDNLELPDPKDVRQRKRTGFSFTRFAIPGLMSHRGKALYLDADMLVLRDIRELWDIPFDRAKIIIQEDFSQTRLGSSDKGRTKKRAKQCSVMLLDCAALNWNIGNIIAGLDGQYTYEELLYEMCILDESEIKYGVPLAWNSLETFENNKTGLIHYTDMESQPWVYARNKNGYLWIEELRIMLANGSLKRSEIENEITSGYFRPSLLTELQDAASNSVEPITEERAAKYERIDANSNFLKHRSVQEAQRVRQKAVEQYESDVAKAAGLSATLKHSGLTQLKKIAKTLRTIRTR